MATTKRNSSGAVKAKAPKIVPQQKQPTRPAPPAPQKKTPAPAQMAAKPRAAAGVPATPAMPVAKMAPVLQQTRVVIPPAVVVPFDLIARRAYEIWLQKTQVANDSLRNWLEAEAELRANFGRHPS